jgi:hypothetical protein
LWKTKINLPLALPWARLLSNQSKAKKIEEIVKKWKKSEKIEKEKVKKNQNLQMLVLDFHGGDQYEGHEYCHETKRGSWLHFYKFIVFWRFYNVHPVSVFPFFLLFSTPPKLNEWGGDGERKEERWALVLALSVKKRTLK